MSAVQRVCLSCGRCCDGSIFTHANFKEHDYNNSDLINYFPEIKSQKFLSLPCRLFTSKCPVYNETRPQICQTFKCRVLHNIENGIYGEARAEELVAMLHNLVGEYRQKFEIFQNFDDNLSLSENHEALLNNKKVRKAVHVQLQFATLKFFIKKHFEKN